MTAARLAVDIGGTFTDLALEHGGKRTTVKVLTTPAAPEQGVMEGVRTITRTALITTEGFRDVLEMGNESRYDQYDLNIVLPEPLVPRYLRLPVPERLDNEGNVLLPLDERAVRALIPVLQRECVESVA